MVRGKVFEREIGKSMIEMGGEVIEREKRLEIEEGRGRGGFIKSNKRSMKAARSGNVYGTFY